MGLEVALIPSEATFESDLDLIFLKVKRRKQHFPSRKNAS